ncbi:hypothetical protein CMEL01_14053 [Colletotrichum melonis]|uniref:Uncharacterized protein n=1 Tax=Colletotrichum melonis TaxID=1209925 RepID=A0AAI9XVY7_9PEZI|nr:hypothetical protein CMEL01_14053 [Colletotrichum melonis]
MSTLKWRGSMSFNEGKTSRGRSDIVGLHIWGPGTPGFLSEFSDISVSSQLKLTKYSPRGPATLSLIDGPNLPVQDAGQRHRWGAPA